MSAVRGRECLSGGGPRSSGRERDRSGGRGGGGGGGAGALLLLEARDQLVDLLGRVLDPVGARVADGAQDPARDAYEQLTREWSGR